MVIQQNPQNFSIFHIFHMHKMFLDNQMVFLYFQVLDAKYCDLKWKVCTQLEQLQILCNKFNKKFQKVVSMYIYKLRITREVC